MLCNVYPYSNLLAWLTTVKFIIKTHSHDTCTHHLNWTHYENLILLKHSSYLKLATTKGALWKTTGQSIIKLNPFSSPKWWYITWWCSGECMKAHEIKVQAMKVARRSSDESNNQAFSSTMRVHRGNTNLQKYIVVSGRALITKLYPMIRGR